MSPSDEADDRDKEQLALQLRRELLDLDVESVEPLAAEAPDGTRAGLAVVAGTLVATLSPAHVSAVVVVVIGWLRRSPAERNVRIEIDGDVIEVRNVDLDSQTKADRGVPEPGTPTRSAPEPGPVVTGQRRALIIATERYDAPSFTELAAPAHDAQALRNVLSDPTVGGFEVTVLRNPTTQEARLAIESFFVEVKRDDLLLIHFSCHGVKNPEGELYLAMRDTMPNRLAATGLPADFVNRLMASSRRSRSRSSSTAASVARSTGACDLGRRAAST